jgi:hypothetical protein
MSQLAADGGLLRRAWAWYAATAALAVLSVAGCLALPHPASLRRSLLAWVEGARYLDEAGIIHQRTRNDCGVACIRMTVSMLARRLDERGLPVVESEKGVSIADVSVSLRREGVDSEPWSVAYDRLGCVPSASILHLGSQHFVVLESADDGVIVRDPELGRLRFAAADFRPMWDGKAIVVFAEAGVRSRFAACMRR